jgi:hypothetical protein
MNEFDDLGVQPEAGHQTSPAAIRREAAIKRGRALGENEVVRRGEKGEEAVQRIARAMAYAAWEADGSPAGREAHYAKEFGIAGHTVTGIADRDPYRLLLSAIGDKAKEEKPKKGKR